MTRGGASQTVVGNTGEYKMKGQPVKTPNRKNECSKDKNANMPKTKQKNKANSNEKYNNWKNAMTNKRNKNMPIQKTE